MPPSNTPDLPQAFVLANGAYCSAKAKTAHGLVRGTDRFRIRAVIDSTQAGKDAGYLLDLKNREIPICASIAEALEKWNGVKYCIVGVATHGGRIPPEIRAQVIESLRLGISVVSGLHEFLSEDPEIRVLAEARGLELIDVRKPAPRTQLHFWSGEILKLDVPILAVLGTDCALGKRTTTRLLWQAFRSRSKACEMIYTGQTGWMQGGRYGLILDSLPNDFVSGEMEHAILRAVRESGAELILIEGQSGLQNPSGPCGAEFILSGRARGIILQHAPARTYFDGLEEYRYAIPSLEEEVALLKHYGARTVAISVNESGMKPDEIEMFSREQERRLGIPVVAPLSQGVERLMNAVDAYCEDFHREKQK